MLNGHSPDSGAVFESRNPENRRFSYGPIGSVMWVLLFSEKFPLIWGLILLMK